MINEEFIKSLKKLVVDEQSAINAYRGLAENKNNFSNYNVNQSSEESSGNIQEIGMEKAADDEYIL